MASNNRVEVHVGAKTSGLSSGMKQAEKIVDSSVKKIESSGDGIKLKVDTSQLTGSMKKATAEVQDSLKKSTGSISKSLSESFKNAFSGTKIGSSIDGVTSKLGLLRGGVLLAGAALAGLAAAAAGLANLAVETARSNVELARAASLANSSLKEFQGLAGAAQTLGFSQEKVADMMKDFNEKIGEFASVGAGGAMDFFEQIAVKTEGGAAGAKKLAEEMSKMDGTTALQTYVDKLEEAGVNQQQMSFYLESMGSDLTALAPILQDGGKLWKEYQQALEDAGITTGQEAVEKSIELNAQTQTLQMQFGALKSELAMAVMPVLSNLLSHFMNGANAGSTFATVIETVGVVARGVAIAITGLATGLQSLVRLISGAMSNLRAIGTTAVNFTNADGILAKGKALASGVKGIWAETKNTAKDIVNTTNSGLASMGNMWSGGASFDKLTQANINNQKAQLNFKGGSGGVTSGIGQNKELNPTAKAAKKPKSGPSEEERRAEQEARAIAAIRYKYASEEQKIALDLQKALEEISKAKISDTEKAELKVKAEQVASEKLKALHTEQFDQIKALREEEIANALRQAQRIYDIEKANLDAELDAKRITNTQKVVLERQLEDQLRQIKRAALEERLGLEDEYSERSGKRGDQGQISNEIADLDTDQAIADTKSTGLMSQAQMQDFEDKFGGLTSRISSLWDQGIQSMMNGTLTWQNATNAILTDMGAFAIQSATQELQERLKIQAVGLAKKLGFIKTETVAEATGQAAQSTAVVAGEATKTTATGVGVLTRLGLKAGEAIKSIMMYAWEAMAGAFKAMVSIPYIGPVLAVAAGASALALVGGLAGKIKSARGGYDIPAGVNPVTQLHEEEMVLPKQHANTIRALGKSMSGGGMEQPAMAGDGGGMASINIQAWDSRDVKRFMKSHGREFASSLQSYARGFGK